MSNDFHHIPAEEIDSNAFQLVGSDWMLITSGTLPTFNTMTASWGGFGVIWNRRIAWCVIRPQRHTYQFAEKHGLFTLSFFEEQYRPALKYCGTHSGRDVDKMAATGLTPVASPDGSVYFGQARLVMECRKLYYHDLDPERFLDRSINDEYPDRDYHRMYVGEIIRCLTR